MLKILSKKKKKEMIYINEIKKWARLSFDVIDDLLYDQI